MPGKTYDITIIQSNSYLYVFQKILLYNLKAARVYMTPPQQSNKISPEEARA